MTPTMFDIQGDEAPAPQTFTERDMARNRTLRPRILAALRDARLSALALADMLGTDVAAVGDALLDMPDRVRAVGDGRWTLAEPWEQPSAEPPTYAGWEPERFPVPVADGGW